MTSLLREAGVGADVRHAAIFSPDKEEILWSTRTIGTHSPLALIRAVFFYLGKTLCLRGGTEQRSLKPSQFRRESDRYVYIENGSKNHQGAFGKGKSENKIVSIYQNLSIGERCPVFLIDLYFSKFPQPPDKFDYFYLKPLSTTPADSTKPWFLITPIGRNTLAKFVENMCVDAGLENKPTTVYGPLERRLCLQLACPKK